MLPDGCWTPAHTLLMPPRRAVSRYFPPRRAERYIHCHPEGTPPALGEKVLPAVGPPEPPQPLANRACEGAPLVTEELALEKTRRDRSTIQLDERSLAP